MPPCTGGTQLSSSCEWVIFTIIILARSCCKGIFPVFIFRQISIIHSPPLKFLRFFFPFFLLSRHHSTESTSRVMRHMGANEWRPAHWSDRPPWYGHVTKTSRPIDRRQHYSPEKERIFIYLFDWFAVIFNIPFSSWIIARATPLSVVVSRLHRISAYASGT